MPQQELLFTIRCSCGGEIVLESKWLSAKLSRWPVGYHAKHETPADLTYQISRAIRRLQGRQ